MKFLTSNSNFVPYCTYQTICEVSSGTVAGVDTDSGYCAEDLSDAKERVLSRLEQKALDEGGNGLFNIHYSTSMTNTFDMNGYPSDDHALILMSANVVKAKMLDRKQVNKNVDLLEKALTKTRQNFQPSKKVDVGKKDAINQYSNDIKDSAHNKKNNESNNSDDSHNGMTFIPPCFWL